MRLRLPSPGTVQTDKRGIVPLECRLPRQKRQSLIKRIFHHPCYNPLQILHGRLCNQFSVILVLSKYITDIAVVTSRSKGRLLHSHNHPGKHDLSLRQLLSRNLFHSGVGSPCAKHHASSQTSNKGKGHSAFFPTLLPGKKGQRNRVIYKKTGNGYQINQTVHLYHCGKSHTEGRRRNIAQTSDRQIPLREINRPQGQCHTRQNTIQICHIKGKRHPCQKPQIHRRLQTLSLLSKSFRALSCRHPEKPGKLHQQTVNHCQKDHIHQLDSYEISFSKKKTQQIKEQDDSRLKRVAEQIRLLLKRRKVSLPPLHGNLIYLRRI